MQHIEFGARSRGHIDRVFSRLFGHCQGHSGIHLAGVVCHFLALGLYLRCRAWREPDITLRQLRAGINPSHLTQEHGAAIAHAHHQVANIVFGLEKLTGLHRQHLTIVRLDDRARRHAKVGRCDRTFQT